MGKLREVATAERAGQGGQAVPVLAAAHERMELKGWEHWERGNASAWVPATQAAQAATAAQAAAQPKTGLMLGGQTDRTQTVLPK